MKKWLRSSISLLLAVVMTLSSAAFVRADESVDITKGLLAHYDFESVEGTQVENKVTSNTTATATLSGGAAVTDLNGTNPLGSSLKLTTAQDGMQLTNIVNASKSSFSVSMWYKLEGTSAVNVNLLQAGTIGGSTGRTILILSPESRYYTYLTGDNAKVTTANAVDRTQWQNITFAYDRDSGKAWFYVNGVADNAGGITLSGTALDVADMIVGRHRNVEGPCNGLIDEIRIYDKAVTAQEAKAIYDTTKALLENDAPPAEPTGPITLTVDVNDPQRIIDSGSIFGINHRYAFNGYGSFDSTTMQIKEDFKALYEDAGFGSIRYPGGTISNLFNWKTTIGPVAERKNQIHGFYNNAGQAGIAPNFGLTEIATFAEDVDSEIVYVYSLGRGNAQDAADLIEYLNAKVGTNPNGGIDWAAVRAENGHPEPYGVRYFEIGNEMQQAWGGSDGTASQGYWTTNVAAGAETAYIDGGTAVFNQQYAVCEEDWNQQASKSTGEANMVRYMRYANVNPKMLDENGKLVDDPAFKAVNDSVSVYVGGTQWTEVKSFENSGSADKHFVIDYSTGAIHFGDGVKGAIPAAGAQINVSYSVDRQGFIDVSKAIKNTVDKINELEGTNYEAHVYSSFETAGFISKMQQRNANEWYDGLTIHPYSGTPAGTGESFYDSAMLLAENVGVHKVQEYVDMMPADKVPVISEYGIFRSTDPLVRSQTHAIYIAKVLMEYVRLGSPYIQKHCLIDWYSSGADSLGPTQQAVIQAVKGSDANTVTGEGTFTFFSTPSAHVFKMLNAGFGDTVVSTEFSTVPAMANGAKALSALAATDSDSNIYVAIVNASRTESYPLTMAFEGISAAGATVNLQMLTTDSYADQNSPENPNNVAVTELTFTIGAEIPVYEIPAHTFVVLKIDPVADLDTTTVVSGFTADPVELPTKGGEVTVAITGRNLPEGITVKCGDMTAVTSGNSIKQTAKLTLPANTGKEDQVYGLQYSLDGETFAGDLSVTVAVNKYDPDDDSRDIPVTVLTATAGDSQSGEGPQRVLDNDAATLWHTDWYGTSRANHWIQFELSEDYTVDGLRYQPRQNGTNGNITKYELQISSDGKTFETVKSGTWDGNASWKIVNFSGVQAKFVRLVALNSMSDSSYVFASAAEIRLTGTKAGAHEHSFGEWVITTEPTCTEDGARERVCQCGEKETEVIPALGHSYNEQGVCSRCFALSETSSVIGLTVKRGELMHLLWAMKGCPEPADLSILDSITDVSADDYYAKAIAWALENSIINCVAANTFAPDWRCNRAQVVNFMWRAAGFPEPTLTECPYVDADNSEFYYKPMMWAIEHGLTIAITCDYMNFRPDKYATYDQILGDTVSHIWERMSSDVSCTTGGHAACVCTVCGHTVDDIVIPAPGHDFVNGDCSRCDEVLTSRFEDVKPGLFYFDPVEWAVGKGITTGATAATFNPDGQCQRAQVVTFLWRAAGSPEPTKTENPFKDVKETDFYYKAVLWAVEQKITNGLTDDTFGPFALCNRAQVVTFLYRAMGEPEVSSTENPFKDVNPAAWYGPAVLWAVEKGITNGLSANSFGVETVCNRAQVVTFLYRTYVK